MNPNPPTVTPPTGVPGVTSALCSWTAELECTAVPGEVLEHTARLVLDGIGAGLFGSVTPWGRLVSDLVVEQGGAAEASVWGTGAVVPATQAPLANGTFMHSFEFDDLHAPAVIHGAAQVVPAALAVAGRRLAQLGVAPTTEELVLACVAGFEVGARVGLATGSAQLGRGFHPSPNTGLFSAAATAGRLLGLDAQGLQHAFGIAASSGGFLMAAQYGAMVKRMHPGRSAQAGVLAAILAARGFTGIGDVVEEPYGGFARAYAGVGAAELEEVTADLGGRWETLRFSQKAYPCCGSNHTSIDALAAILQRAPELRAADIDSISVRCSTLTAHHVGWRYVPDSVTSAQMNLAYTLAVQAVDGQVFVEQFDAERISDPEVVDLASRVFVEPDPDIDTQGREARHLVRVSVLTRNGRRYVEEVRHARGSAHRPLSSKEVVEKYRRLAGTVLEKEGVENLLDNVLALAAPSADPEPVQALLAALARPRSSAS